MDTREGKNDVQLVEARAHVDPIFMAGEWGTIRRPLWQTPTRKMRLGIAGSQGVCQEDQIAPRQRWSSQQYLPQADVDVPGRNGMMNEVMI